MSAILQPDLPPATRRTTRAAGSRTGVAVSRWIAGSVLVVVGILAVVFEHAIRVVEIQVATVLAGATFATDTMFAWMGSDPVIGFTMGHGWFAAQATLFSGSAFFAAAIAIVGGALILLGQLSWMRGLIITGSGVVAIVALGQVRLLLDAWFVGSTAQQGAHALDHPVGVAAMIILALAVFTFFFAIRSARRARTA